jgi:hypothetical protein
MVLSMPALVKLYVIFNVETERYMDEEREMIASAFGAANTRLETLILPLYPTMT